MRRTRRPAPRLLPAAVLLAAAAFFLYACWLWIDLGGSAGAGRPAAAGELPAARAAFREGLLDVNAHMRLAQALYRAGRAVDSFYVLYAARNFFGESPFFQAHARLVPDDERNRRERDAAAKSANVELKQRGDPEAALPALLALYRLNPGYNDGEPAEDKIRRVLDERRERLLGAAAPDELGKFLKSDDGSLRAQACVNAARLQDPRWIDALAGLLDDDAEIVRHNADYALFQIGRKHPELLLARRAEWLDSPNTLLRIRALNLFADLDPRNTFPAAAKALFDPRPAVRLTAKIMVIDRYYKNFPQAGKLDAEYRAFEKDPAVLAFYERLMKR